MNKVSHAPSLWFSEGSSGRATSSSGDSNGKDSYPKPRKQSRYALRKACVYAEVRDKVSFLVLLLCLGSRMTMANLTQSPPAPNSARLLLAELRHGDYAHAGDEEAIDLVIEQLLALNPQIKAGPMLDVGSGFGGTLHYLIQKGFKKAQGIDIDASAVAYAKQRYPKIPFHTLDALKVDTLFLCSIFWVASSPFIRGICKSINIDFRS